MAKEETHPNVELIRSITRPVITFTLIIGWIFQALLSIDIPWAYQAITILMTLEWVTERGIMRFRELFGRKHGNSS